jgi:cobalt-zinc-cadmium efflux system membrane fusion protein
MTETPSSTQRSSALPKVLGALALVALSVAGTLAAQRVLHHGEAGHGHEDEHAEGAHGEGAHGEHRGEGKIRLTPAMLENAKVTTRTSGPGKVVMALSLPGEVALNVDRVAHVTPRVSGTVREAKSQLGDVVKKGDTLAILDSRDLAEMQREALAAKERLDLAETNFKRQEQLWQEKISAEKDYLAAKQALAEAKIEHRAASQKLAAGAGARTAGGGLVLTAPLDGTIIEKHAVVGEVLNDDKLAFVVADLSSLWVNVTVYAKDLPRVHVGQKVIVRAEGIVEPAYGELSYIDRVVGEQTRSATARVVLDQPPAKWRPGLFATAEIVLDEVEVPIAVLQDAVQRVDGKSVVFVKEGEFFVTHTVTTGRQGYATGSNHEVLIEVLGGLNAGETYAAENSFILKAELGKAAAGHEH